MKTRALTAVVAMSAALLVAPAQAQTLDASAAKAVMSGANITGTNSFGNPYSVTFNSNGTIDGVAGLNNEFKDTGSWWMDGNKFCRKYKAWLEAKAECFGISTESGNVRFHNASGKVIDTAKLN